MDPYAALCVSPTSCSAFSDDVDPYAALCVSSTSCSAFSDDADPYAASSCSAFSDDVDPYAALCVSSTSCSVFNEDVDPYVSLYVSSTTCASFSGFVEVDSVGRLCIENSSIFNLFISTSIQDVMIIRTAKGTDRIIAVTAPVATPAMAGLEFVSVVAITLVSAFFRSILKQVIYCVYNCIVAYQLVQILISG